ncbi:MAG: hypothetical protein A2W85_04185 [Bacteroidetes bacterium GWF2_41_31]|nr:MAG: hypothetical protein A2W85_04185 [Bacteroidetes bacterium GWF2_41_31]OFZ09481.1 MAG: hypothetical protein A2338_00585 [Bacteroidetes bacterium RIFOXYB12_FULL_41_6]
MKGIFKVIILVLIVVASGNFSSCSKKSAGFASSTKHTNGGSSYDPAATKDRPIRKKFIINQQRGTILGHKKPL